MLAGGQGGALIAVSSVASRDAAPLMHTYATAKAALSGLVRSVAAELAPQGIRANVLIPGFTENGGCVPTPVSAEYNTEVVSSIPAGRWGTPDDIGAAAVYLADPALAYHTGAELVVDGGLLHHAAVPGRQGRPPAVGSGGVSGARAGALSSGVTRSSPAAPLVPRCATRLRGPSGRSPGSGSA